MKELEDPGRGPYNDNFITLNCVGKGAFGFVNLAENKATKEKVRIQVRILGKILGNCNMILTVEASIPNVTEP